MRLAAVSAVIIVGAWDALLATGGACGRAGSIYTPTTPSEASVGGVQAKGMAPMRCHEGRGIYRVPARAFPSEILRGICTSKGRPVQAQQQRRPPVQAVYVLELEGGRVYVGKSQNVSRRAEQHTGGRGAAFTKLYRPTGRLLPRLGSLDGDGDGPERDETLRQMEARGCNMVRGWKFTGRTLTAQDRAEIEANVRELRDLCRRCGREGHFSHACEHATDRHGKRLA